MSRRHRVIIGPSSIMPQALSAIRLTDSTDPLRKGPASCNGSRESAALRLASRLRRSRDLDVTGTTRHARFGQTGSLRAGSHHSHR